MEPTTTATIILSVVGLLAGVIAHLRIRSKCHLGEVLEISFTKETDIKIKEVEIKQPEIKQPEIKQPEGGQEINKDFQISSLTESDTEI